MIFQLSAGYVARSGNRPATMPIIGFDQLIGFDRPQHCRYAHFRTKSGGRHTGTLILLQPVRRRIQPPRMEKRWLPDSIAN